MARGFVALAVVLAVLVAGSFAYEPHTKITEPAQIVLTNVLMVDAINNTVTNGAIWFDHGIITNITQSGPDTSQSSYYTVLDFKSQFYASPGFVSIEASMIGRSAIPAPTASNLAGIHLDDTASAADFTTVSSMSQEDRFNTVYKPVLQANLQSGITTWVDIFSNPDDFMAFRDNYVGNNVLSFPNLWSMGPIIGAPNLLSHLTNTPWKYSFDVSIGLQQALTQLNNTKLVNWFNRDTYDLRGITVFSDVPGDANQLDGTATQGITAMARAYRGDKRVGFTSFVTNTIVAAVNGGANIHYGTPFLYPAPSAQVGGAICDTNSVSYNSTLCQTLPANVLQSLMLNDVVSTTSISRFGNVGIFVNPFIGGTYPNPNNPIYYKRGYYQLGMPDFIRNNYEAAFQIAASSAGTNAATTLVTAARRVLTAEMMLMNVAASYGAGFVLATGAGEPWAIHGFFQLEALTLYGSSAVSSSRQALYSMTVGAAKAVGLERLVGRLEVGKYGDIIITTNNPLQTMPGSWDITTVFKFGFKQPDVGVIYIYGVAMALGAVGFAFLLVILFVSYTVCCARLAEQSKRGDMASSMLA